MLCDSTVTWFEPVAERLRALRQIICSSRAEIRPGVTTYDRAEECAQQLADAEAEETGLAPEERIFRLGLAAYMAAYNPNTPGFVTCEVRYRIPGGDDDEYRSQQGSGRGTFAAFCDAFNTILRELRISSDGFTIDTFAMVATESGADAAALTTVSIYCNGQTFQGQAESVDIIRSPFCALAYAIDSFIASRQPMMTTARCVADRQESTLVGQ